MGLIALTVALQFTVVYSLRPIFKTDALDASAMGMIKLAVVGSVTAIGWLKFGYSKGREKRGNSFIGNLIISFPGGSG